MNDMETRYDIKRICSRLDPDYYIYPDSINYISDVCFFISKIHNQKRLVIIGDSGEYPQFKGDTEYAGEINVKLCDLNIKNSMQIRNIFPFTKPVSLAEMDFTFGTGDRLGIASPGHLRALKGRRVFPVLAQQSLREMELTGRTYKDVLSDVVWSVYQEGYRDGYGADGDHLKTFEEIEEALENGFSMITVDCSEYINYSANEFDNEQINKMYEQLEFFNKRSIERKYIGKEFRLNSGYTVKYTEDIFKKTVIIYWKAIQYIVQVYAQITKKYKKQIDFEISIDETSIATSPESHFLFASEIINGGTAVTSIAPRFCGEFQKGIDYLGDLKMFTYEFKIHVDIANTLGYKISVHSASDKFSVYPIMGSIAGGRIHIKTSGTSWLEAVRILAIKSPDLYREIHRFALAKFDEAKKYYKVSADINKIPDINSLEDERLPKLLDQDDSRQLIHITFGFILQERNSQDNFCFRNRIFNILDMYEKEYYAALQSHIGKHIDALQVKKHGAI